MDKWEIGLIGLVVVAFVSLLGGIVYSEHAKEIACIKAGGVQLKGGNCWVQKETR